MSRIKGVTISIDGETRGLDKALSDVNKRSKDLQGELRQVDRLLKFNPGNTELLAQKQKLLGDQVETTRERLNRLKAAQDEVTKSFQRGEISEEQYRAFQREIVQTESKLEHFSKQLKSVEKDLNTYGKSMQEAGQKMKDFGDRTTSVGKDMSMKVTAPILGIGTAAVMAGANFEEGMSRVASLSGATGDELQKLEDQAREMGATTRFSALEAADAQAFLAMAGYNTSEIMSSLPGLLDLAAAGQLDLGRAADITTNIMAGFNIETEKTGEVADILALSAASANTSVEQMGTAMSYVAPVAAGAGISIEETAAAIGLLSDAGIQGERAGTALRGAITRLQNPVGEAQKVMNELGLSIDDVNPSTHSLAEILKTLEGSGMDSAQAMRMFGDAAGPGMISLLGVGEQGLSDFTNELENSEGAAKRIADVMSDNLKGGIDEMKSAFTEAGISVYQNLQPALESLVETIKSVADWFNNLSPRMQNTIVIISGIVAAIGPLLIILGTLASSFGSIITVAGKLVTGFGGVGKAITGVRTAITLMTGPIGIAIAAITALVAIGIHLYQNWDEIKERLSEIWESIGEIGSNVWNGIKDFFAETWDAIKSTATTVWDSIMDFFKEWGSTIIAVITGPIGIVAKFLYDNWDSIKTFIASTVESIKNTVSDKFQDLRGAVRNWMERTYENIMSIWNRAETFLRNINLFEIGTNIIQGLINGIQDKVAELWSVVGDIAGGIKDFFANALGIASRSKVFMEFGKDIGDGLTIGLDKSLASVQAAASKMTDTLTPASSSVTGSYNSNVFNIHVQGGTPRDQVDGIIRELHKRGIKV